MKAYADFSIGTMNGPKRWFLMVQSPNLKWTRLRDVFATQLRAEGEAEYLGYQVIKKADSY